jgi:hypothetical protein
MTMAVGQCEDGMFSYCSWGEQVYNWAERDWCKLVGVAKIVWLFAWRKCSEFAPTQSERVLWRQDAVRVDGHDEDNNTLVESQTSTCDCLNSFSFVRPELAEHDEADMVHAMHARGSTQCRETRGGERQDEGACMIRSVCLSAGVLFCCLWTRRRCCDELPQFACFLSDMRALSLCLLGCLPLVVSSDVIPLRLFVRAGWMI